MLNFFAIIGASLFGILLLMTVLWVIYYFINIASVVDVCWAFGFVLIAWIAFFIGEGALIKRIAMTAMVTIWGVRLGGHLLLRLKEKGEDPRYIHLQERWGGEGIRLKFLILFLFQGLLILILSTPIFIVADFAEGTWHAMEFLAIVLFGLSLAGEYYADRQLKEFTSKPENAGRVCKKGLWYYSRHPNYFFEFLIWVSFAAFALGSSWGVFALISPLIVYGLLNYISGIPLAEAESLKSKNVEYSEYKRTTNAFFPWPPKSS